MKDLPKNCIAGTEYVSPCVESVLLVTANSLLQDSQGGGGGIDPGDNVED